MCAGTESVVLVFHGAFHPLRDGCLRLQICPFCGSGSIPLFFDNKRPGLHQQPGALVFAGRFRGRDRDRMEKPPLLEPTAAVLMFASHPLRGATVNNILKRERLEISIHAPLAGRDYEVESIVEKYIKFQSTHPLQGATANDYADILRHAAISIHAPLAGCDGRSTRRCHTALLFQSTHPLRGATASL